MIEKYIPHVADALKDLVELTNTDVERIEENLSDILEKTRGEIKQVAQENTEYDAEFAKIGAENEESN